jgi:hypothetical protein
VSIDLADETGIVRAMGLKETATAESAQFEAEEVGLNMLTMLTVRCYSGMVVSDRKVQIKKQ